MDGGSSCEPTTRRPAAGQAGTQPHTDGNRGTQKAVTQKATKGMKIEKSQENRTATKGGARAVQSSSFFVCFVPFCVIPSCRFPLPQHRSLARCLYREFPRAMLLAVSSRARTIRHDGLRSR